MANSNNDKHIKPWQYSVSSVIFQHYWRVSHLSNLVGSQSVTFHCPLETSAVICAACSVFAGVLSIYTLFTVFWSRGALSSLCCHFLEMTPSRWFHETLTSNKNSLVNSHSRCSPVQPCQLRPSAVHDKAACSAIPAWEAHTQPSIKSVCVCVCMWNTTRFLSISCWKQSFTAVGGFSS